MTCLLLTHRCQSCHLGRLFREAMVGELAAKCLYTWTALLRDCRQESSCREARHSALFELDSPEAVSSRDEVSYIVSGSSEAGCHGIEEAMSTKRFTTKVQVHSCCHWLYLFHWTPMTGSHRGVCLFADVNHFSFMSLASLQDGSKCLHPALLMWVIYMAVLWGFDTYQSLEPTVSRGLPKNQSTETVQSEDCGWE